MLYSDVVSVNINLTTENQSQQEGYTNMSNAQLRKIIRWSHIVQGSLIAAFIYSSALRESDVYTALIQIVVVPAVILSGVLMWQQARVMKWVRGSVAMQREG